MYSLSEHWPSRKNLSPLLEATTLCLSQTPTKTCKTGFSHIRGDSNSRLHVYALTQRIIYLHRNIHEQAQMLILYFGDD